MKTSFEIKGGKPERTRATSHRKNDCKLNFPREQRMQFKIYRTTYVHGFHCNVNYKAEGLQFAQFISVTHTPRVFVIVKLVSNGNSQYLPFYSFCSSISTALKNTYTATYIETKKVRLAVTFVFGRYSVWISTRELSWRSPWAQFLYEISGITTLVTDYSAFVPNSFQFIHHPIIQHYICWDTERVLKQLPHKMFRQ